MTASRDCVPLLEFHNLYAMARWASDLPVRHGWKGRTCRDVWAAAPRGDWLLEYAAEAGAERRDMVRAAAACVRPALRFVPEGEDRPRLAVEAAERWAARPTEENRRRAKRAGEAAWAAGSVMAAAATAATAATATTVAASAWAAAWAAGSVAWVSASLAADAADAAGASAWAAARAAGVGAHAAGLAAGRAAEAHSYAEGSESESAAHLACADVVRRLVPFLDLAAGGPE